MLQKRFSPLALAAAATLAFSHPSSAGGGGALTGGAREITQMMNNAELVLIGIEEKLQTIEQIEQTYLGRLQQLRSSIGEYTAPFLKAYSTYQRVSNLHSQLAGLGEKAKHFDQSLDSRFKEFSASHLTWVDWMERERRLVQQNDAGARARLAANREVLLSLDESMQAYQKAAEGMEDTPGVHQAVRQLAPLLQTLGGDVNKLIAVTSQEAYTRDLDRQQQAGEKQRTLDERAAHNARQRALNEKNRAEFDRMLNTKRPPTNHN